MYVHMLIIPLVPYCERILEQSTELPNLLKELQILNTIATVLVSLLMHLILAECTSSIRNVPFPRTGSCHLTC